MDLKTLDDKALVLNIQQNTDLANDAIIELTERHCRLVSSLYKKYNYALQASGIYPQDVFTDPSCLIYDAALQYDPEKGTKYSSWLSNHLRYKSLNAMNAGHRILSQEPNVIDYLAAHTLEESESKERLYEKVVDLVEQIPDETAKNIIKDRFLDRRSKKRRKARKWKTIGRLNNISQQRAIEIKNQTLKELREKLK